MISSWIIGNSHEKSLKWGKRQMERAWIRIIILNYGWGYDYSKLYNNGFDFAMWEREEGTKNWAEGVEEIVSVWMKLIWMKLILWNWQFNGKMFA